MNDLLNMKIMILLKTVLSESDTAIEVKRQFTHADLTR